MVRFSFVSSMKPRSTPQVPIMTCHSYRVGFVLATKLCFIVIAGFLVALQEAKAEEHITVLTNWYAQAEHGGIYQAEASGGYQREGLAVTIKQGGPQLNGMQLLLAGEADIVLGYDLQVLKSLENKVPVVAVAASFQSDLVGIMAREDVHSLADLKGKTILVATPGRATWWPWLKKKYDLSDDQVKPYTFNLQPFVADGNTVQQAYPSSEPFQAAKSGVPVRFLPLKQEGYPPYGLVFVVTRDTLLHRPEVIKRFLKATFEGWRAYLVDPSLAQAAIHDANPAMTEEQLAYVYTQLISMGVIDSGDAKTLGLGIITDARFKATYDFLTGEGLLKPEVDYHDAFDDRLIKDLHIQ